MPNMVFACYLKLSQLFTNSEQQGHDIKQMLSDAKRINAIMQRLRLERDAQNDWLALRSDLDKLEGMFGRFDRFDRPRR